MIDRTGDLIYAKGTIEFGGIAMNLLNKVFRQERKLSEKETLIAQVAATHAAWYPLHNEGRQPPEAALTAWIQKLAASGLDESELILLVADHKSRNRLLGKTWP